MAFRFRQAAIRAKNPAIQRAIGQKNVKKVDLPLFTNVEAASWAAQRILAELSYPLLRVTLTVNRKAFRLCPGDLFILNYSPYGIQNVVMRVLSIEEEGLSNERLKVQAVQDIEYAVEIPNVVGLKTRSYWLDYQVVALTHVRIEEPPYIIGELPCTIVPIAAREKGIETGAFVFGSVDGGDTYFQIGTISTFAVYGKLTSSLPPSGTSFTVDIPLDANRLETNLLAVQEKRNLLLIGSEYIRFESITPVGSTENEYEISGLHRGLYDTALQDHPIGSEMYYVDDLDMIQWSALEPGNDYYFKIVPFNESSTGKISEATAILLHFRELSLCPRSVVNLRANTLSYDAVYYGEQIALTWDPRVRWSDEIPTALEYCDGFFKVEVYAADSNPVTEETFLSDCDTPVQLAHDHIVGGSEIVSLLFEKDTDYTMDYPAGTITVLSSGSMEDAAEYHIAYDYIATYSAADEPFVSDWDSPVQLEHDNIAEGSEVVTTTGGGTTFTRGTDYTMDYSAGTITVLSTGSMADNTEYSIDYDYGVIESIADETFVSDYDNPVQLEHDDIVEDSEVVTRVYEEGTDYTMDYVTGTITVLSSGSMEDDTEYRISYNYSTLSYTLVRTEVTNPANPFFNEWIYRYEMNVEDNGEPAGYLLFKVYDFIDDKHISEPTEIAVRLEDY